MPLEHCPALRALVLTDVVDSTRIARELGDEAMARCWSAHDRAARDLLPRWRGREIDKADGMLLLFDAADDALGYAADYHRALAAAGLPIQARCGVHYGAVTLRENSADDVARGAKPVEVDGIAKAVAARVMSAAAAGQTLLTVDVHEAATTPPRCRSQGHWRLGGLADPVELYGIVDDEAPVALAVENDKAYRVVRDGDLWRPVREIRHSLPAERDGFVGRRQGLDTLATKLADGARLVTLLGIGGTGKTRLAIRHGWTGLGDYPGGVWFCDLSQARDLDGVLRAVAQGLDVTLGRADPVTLLGRAIGGRGRCLVILDNFEQVAGLADETLGRWLDRAADARFVVTTRERLGLAGEDVMPVEPLTTADAVALFRRRADAAALDRGPEGDGGDEAAIEQLVAVLDRLPLAIELAASRIRVMSPRAMLSRMNDRFRVMVSRGGRRDRQSTLRAAFDWSWDLLGDDEKSALAQLSVFAGGFTIESAAAVIGSGDAGDAGDALPAIDAVHGLVDKSLVRQLSRNRFDLFVSVAAYAAEQLRTPGRFAGSGPAAVAAARSRHAAWFASLDPQRVVDVAGVELENLVAACRNAVDAGDGRTASAALRRATVALSLRGPFRLLLELAESALAMPGLDGRWRVCVEVDVAAARQLCGTGDAGMRSLCESAAAHAHAIADHRLEARALKLAADFAVREGRVDDARELFERALAVVDGRGAPDVDCSVLNALAALQASNGRMDDARRHYETALRIAREHRLRRWEGGSAGNLGQFHATLGHAAEALALYRIAIGIACELGDRQWEANTRCNLGLLHHEQGRLEDAEAESARALTTARELGHSRLVAIVRCNLGLIAEARGRLDDAEQHHLAAIACARELGDHRSEGQFLGYLGLLQARQSRFDDGLRSLAAGESLLQSAGERVGLGIVLCQRAEAERRSGDDAAAFATLARAEAVAAGLSDLEPDSEFGRALARARARADPDLPPVRAAAASGTKSSPGPQQPSPATRS